MSTWALVATSNSSPCHNYILPWPCRSSAHLLVPALTPRQPGRQILGAQPQASRHHFCPSHLHCSPPGHGASAPSLPSPICLTHGALGQSPPPKSLPRPAQRATHCLQGSASPVTSSHLSFISVPLPSYQVPSEESCWNLALGTSCRCPSTSCCPSSAAQGWLAASSPLLLCLTVHPRVPLCSVALGARRLQGLCLPPRASSGI